MAVVISSGPQPVPASTWWFPAGVTPPAPQLRAVLVPGPSAYLFPALSGGGQATVVPVMPVFTRHPVSP